MVNDQRISELARELFGITPEQDAADLSQEKTYFFMRARRIILKALEEDRASHAASNESQESK